MWTFKLHSHCLFCSPCRPTCLLYPPLRRPGHSLRSTATRRDDTQTHTTSLTHTHTHHIHTLTHPHFTNVYIVLSFYPPPPLLPPPSPPAPPDQRPGHHGGSQHGAGQLGSWGGGRPWAQGHLQHQPRQRRQAGGLTPPLTLPLCCHNIHPVMFSLSLKSSFTLPLLSLFVQPLETCPGGGDGGELCAPTEPVLSVAVPGVGPVPLPPGPVLTCHCQPHHQ